MLLQDFLQINRPHQGIVEVEPSLSFPQLFGRPLLGISNMNVEMSISGATCDTTSHRKSQILESTLAELGSRVSSFATASFNYFARTVGEVQSGVLRTPSMFFHVFPKTEKLQRRNSTADKLVLRRLARIADCLMTGRDS